MVEVLVSIAIALILMYGINLVFRTTADTIAVGQQFNNLTRASRNVQSSIFDDFHNCATDSPVFYISSDYVPAYLNADDAKTNNYTYSFGPSSTPYFINAVPSAHLHAIDEVGFFARGLYKRATGGNANSPTALSSQLVSNEAFIHYGHAKAPTSDFATFYGPDDAFAAGAAPPITTTNAPYAADWTLARNAVLLIQNPSKIQVSSNPTTYNNDYFYTKAPSPGFTSPLTPLGYHTLDSNGSGSSYIESSRYDLSATTIDGFRQIVTNAVATNPNFWWEALVYSGAHTGNAAPYTGPTGRYRFAASPVVFTQAAQSQSMSLLSPIFLEHASQFIVEFAGDFTSQDETDTTFTAGVTKWGALTDTIPDGQVDWMFDTKGYYDATALYSAGDWTIVNNASSKLPTFYQFAPSAGTGSIIGGGGPPASGGNWTAATSANPPPRRVRWYGFPRNTSNLVDTSLAPNRLVTAGPYHTTNMSVHGLCDVVPLRDLWTLAVANGLTTTGGSFNPYEVEEPLGDGLVGYNGTGVQIADYSDYNNYTATKDTRTGASTNGVLGFTGATTVNKYVALWRNDVPAMIRILVKVDDPNNQLQSGPWLEFVFKLK